LAACTHADETPGAEDHEIDAGAPAASSFLPCSAVVTQAGPWGSCGGSGSGAAELPCGSELHPAGAKPSAPALQLSRCGADKRGCCCEATNLVPAHEGEERQTFGLTFCDTHDHK